MHSHLNEHFWGALGKQSQMQAIRREVGKDSTTLLQLKAMDNSYTKSAPYTFKLMLLS
jgi:hypothetical protein